MFRLNTVFNTKTIKKGKLTNRNYSLIFIVTLILLIIEIFIGQFVNVNGLVFFTYIVFLYILYILDAQFILKYLWLVVVASLNLLGNFVCDTFQIYLVELERTTFYVKSFTPLVIVYVVLFSVLEMVNLKKGYAVSSDIWIEEKTYNDDRVRLLKTILVIGITISLFLYSRVFATPYFAVGYDRLLYARDFMSQIDRSLKSYLPMFMPIAIMYGRCSGKKFLPVVFFIITVLIYFWVGDKFGTYFNGIYIIALSFEEQIEERQLKRVTIFFCTLIASLLLVVFIYRVLLYNDNVNQFMEYLMQRLAQQGEVWWSVYVKGSGRPSKFFEFGEEIKSILPFGGTDEIVGQWKMLLVSSDYSEYARYRVAVGNPYTATTTASVFYYFGWPGTIVFYILCGLCYGKLVQGTVRFIKNYRALETLVCVKLIMSFHVMLFASDLYLISYKGIIYMLLLFITVYMEKKNIHLRAGRKVKVTR